MQILKWRHWIVDFRNKRMEELKFQSDPLVGRVVITDEILSRALAYCESLEERIKKLEDESEYCKNQNTNRRVRGTLQ